jgi:hypothetical protein
METHAMDRFITKSSFHFDLCARHSKYLAWASLLLGASLFVSISGCQTVAALYGVMEGTNEGTEFSGLRGKKVVVVCRVRGNLHYRDSNVSKTIAQQVSVLLKDNVGKIHLVKQEPLLKWCDEHTWNEFSEVGKAMKADMVVGIDILDFNIFQGQTLYQGNANLVVQVVDCKEDGKVVFKRDMPPVIYPPNTSVPTSERLEEHFRTEFAQVVARNVAQYFYPRDSTSEFARDVDSLK